MYPAHGATRRRRVQPELDMRPCPALLTACAALLLSPASPIAVADAAPVPPSTHLGIAAGGHLVVTDWEAGLTDPDGQQISPEGNGLFRVRLGQQFSTWIGAELGLGFMPLEAGDALGTGLIYDADLLINLKDGPVMPLLVLGGGAYHVYDGRGGSDLDYQFHYGFELRGRVNDRLAIRGGLRHYFADSLEPDQDFSNHIEVNLGFDLLFGADDG